MVTTTIPIDPDVRDNLRAEKVGNETYSDVITRLLDNDGDE
jgi:predicted CopG family antitoxin